MANFLSTTLTDQLQVRTDVLASAIPLNMAVQGSRSKINRTVVVDLKYQSVACKCQFNLVNLENYDIILGTLFLFQHCAVIGLNPSRVSIGSERDEHSSGCPVLYVQRRAGGDHRSVIGVCRRRRRRRTSHGWAFGRSLLLGCVYWGRSYHELLSPSRISYLLPTTQTESLETLCHPTS